GALRVLKFYIPKSVIEIPNAFFDMLPFLMTALVLVVSSARKSSQRKSQMPSYLGVNYFREDR
ncbi:MAG: ABC transporter permease, partial [Christensenellaceae bacterium]|nr:ABC transporter permease [Christensenellaceae bacterium]